MQCDGVEKTGKIGSLHRKYKENCSFGLFQMALDCQLRNSAWGSDVLIDLAGVFCHDGQRLEDSP